MKKTFTLFAVLVSSICSFSQSIDSLMGPRVWLSADRSELTSTGWADLSLYENHAAAESPLVIPSAYDVINFNKSLVFDGIDDYLKIPYSLGGLPELSILAVYQSSDTIERGIWGAGESSRKVLLTTRLAIGPDSVSDAYGKKERITVLNSIMQNWPDAGVSVADGFLALGSAGDGSYKSFKGSIAEILVFNRSLSFLERVQYETYLAIKYGTGLRGGNFVSSGEKVLWHVEKNQNYGRNIASIGRDDAFKLFQKQSGSAYDSGLLVIAAGKLSPNR